ncbi:hypothetical protein [Streptosporangium sp. CA-115845]|uniref:TetR/AcrR family transcriptional regulator n=1 Tax=Streptosporangium sp. CA-115845 TaxID=3240071 RepID=UPI003D94347C
MEAGVESAVSEGVDAVGLGQRMVRTFLTNCDTVGGGVFVALLRSVTGHEQAGRGLHDFMIKHIVVRVLRSVEVDQPEFRATLVAAQMAGLGVIRYVTRYEPMVSAEIDKIAALPHRRHRLSFGQAEGGSRTPGAGAGPDGLHPRPPA